MKKLSIYLALPLALTFLGCTEYDVQTTPDGYVTSNSFSNCVPQVQTCDVCANQTNYQVLPLNQKPQIKPQVTFQPKPAPSTPKKQVVQNVVTVNPKPICSCNKIPMVPANYFVTYEPLGDYPVTYKTKYTESCMCY